MTKKYRRRFIEPRDQYRRWVDPRFRTLRTADAAAYLRDRGWMQLPPDREGFLVFQEPSNGDGDEPYCQFVPEYEDADDYPQRMFEFLTGLAEVEDRPASAVIDDILRQANRPQPNGPTPEPPAATEPARSRTTSPAAPAGG
jgi:hypothetical protein